jgi:hypothetical protein
MKGETWTPVRGALLAIHEILTFELQHPSLEDETWTLGHGTLTSELQPSASKLEK